MRDKFEFLGIQSTPRREALKPLFTGKELPQSSAIATIVDELWSLPEREYQLVAIDLLIKRKKHLSADILPKLEEWITTKSWWDTVDMLATNVVATVYLNHPQQTSTYIQKWRNSEDIWLRRTAILYQLKFKQETDVEHLFELIKENQADNEFFIQKAIGWALREYSKTDADCVIGFIESQQIEGLAKREGLKWLKSRGRWNNLSLLLRNKLLPLTV
ncbi:DNA alkylation repair enzyme [Vibrio ishigakensis]|uniref:DNA alkylation repair enzyme n=1 Tax=Vibrio ishigakensis TaxID=1481914 RepID=A0A0B8PHL7_9VIBR|nr:DNA alkylation repair enzyme [Vibrio ishigakensis]